jgi:hypothetical protein
MFQGIKNTSIASYNQVMFETFINGNPKGNRWDYCFLWCLCYGFVDRFKVRWQEINQILLKKETQKFFNVKSGLCLDLYGFQGAIAKGLDIDMIAIRPEETMTPNLELIQNYIKENNIEDYYIMRRYKPEHYTYVTKKSYEINPYPYELKNSFYGWRLYKWEKI